MYTGFGKMQPHRLDIVKMLFGKVHTCVGFHSLESHYLPARVLPARPRGLCACAGGSGGMLSTT